MKRKVTISFIVMALVCALVGGATFAWFTDTASNTGNTFSTGTLDIALNSQAETAFDLVDQITGNPLAPGDRIDGSFNIKNSGNLDAWVQVNINEIGGLFTAGTADTTSYKLGGSAYTSGTWVKLAAGEEMAFEYNYTLPTSAGNEYQNQTGNFKFEVNAQQVKNNPNKAATDFEQYN